MVEVETPTPSMTTGRLEVGIAADGSLRWFLTDVTAPIEELRRERDLSPLATIALGQLLAACSLLSRLVSKQTQRITVEVDGDGPLGRLRAEIDPIGRLRALAANPQAFAEDPSVPDLGSGTLRVIRQLQEHQYDSRVQLGPGGIARNLAHFLERSEQIRSALLLGVRVRPQGVIAAGGLLVEALPGTDPDIVAGLEERIAAIGSISRLLDRSGAAALLEEVLGDLETRRLEERALVLGCTCNRERFRLQLQELARRDPTFLDSDEPTLIECSFCGATYSFEPAEVQQTN